MENLLTIGLPKNTKVRKDLEPLTEALRLEGASGVERSPLLPGVTFRSLRIRDVARLVKDGIFDMGILCDDVAVECGLSDNKIDGLSLGSETSLSLLVKEEEADDFWEINRRGTILTNYPNAVRTSARDRVEQIDRFYLDNSFAGQLESLVRNGDVPGVVGAVDIVRSGATARQFGLAEIVEFMKSQPGIWLGPKILKSPEMMKSVGDTLQRVNEIFRPYLIDQNGNPFDQATQKMAAKKTVEVINNPDFNLKFLYELLQSRKREMPEGSYTTSLFENGLEAILAKVEEESEEVLRAARGEGRQRLIEEVCDNIYFLFVLMINEGVDISDIENELAKRNMKKSERKVVRSRDRKEDIEAEFRRKGVAVE